MGKRRFLTVVAVMAVAVVAAIGFAVPALAFGPWGQGQGPAGSGVGCFGGGFGQTQAGPGYGPGGMMGGWGYQGQNPTQTTPVSIEQAKKAVDDYVAAGNWGEPLVVSEVMEFQNNFYAAVKEQSTGVGAFELLVNKSTGYVSPEIGPNMMWNAKYGHMAGFAQGWGGMMGGAWGGQRNGLWGPGGQSAPTAEMPVTAADAVEKANAYLGTTGSGLTAENDPTTFYGYYTVDVVDKDGKVAGMLSVNGQSGDVWYHTWHGDFVQEVQG